MKGRENLDKEIWCLFSGYHSPYPTIENKKAPGNFFPPQFGFLSTDLRKISHGEIAYVYNYLHESCHVLGAVKYRLGQYMAQLYDVYEKYILKAKELFDKNNKEFERILDKAEGLLHKINILYKFSATLFEIFPTYWQLGKYRHDFATEMWVFVRGFFPKRKITKKLITKIVEDIGNEFEINIRFGGGTKHKISLPHRNGFFYGEEITEKYSSIEHLYLVPSWSMDVNFDRIDIINIEAGEFKDFIEENPEECNPEIRLQEFLDNPDKAITKQTERFIDRSPFIERSGERIIISTRDITPLEDEVIKFNKKILLDAKGNENMINDLIIDQDMKDSVCNNIGYNYRIFTTKGDLFLVAPLLFKDDEIKKELTRIIANRTLRCANATKELLGVSLYDSEDFLDCLEKIERYL